LPQKFIVKLYITYVALSSYFPFKNAVFSRFFRKNRAFFPLVIQKSVKVQHFFRQFPPFLPARTVSAVKKITVCLALAVKCRFRQSVRLPVQTDPVRQKNIFPALCQT